MALTRVSDVIVPEIFTPYSRQRTEEKSRLIASGAVVRSPVLDGLLAGGGKVFNVPSFQDLDASDGSGADVSVGDQAPDIQAASFENGTPTDANRNDLTPQKIATSQEQAARLVRAQAWQSARLTGLLAGDDPQRAIAEAVASYWARRYQRTFVNVINGVLADNALAPNGADTHVQNDLTYDIKGGAFADGVTTFSAEAAITAKNLLGDSEDDLAIIMVHSTVYARMKKNNLIDFIPDARGETDIRTFMGMEVIVDDGMPVTNGVYDTWIFGRGAMAFGETLADVPTEVHNEPLAGNGGGSETLITRRVLTMHPIGHAYIDGSIPDGGPSNADLATAANWRRVYPERKQIKFARLVTREAPAV
jgi:hypothetical protein